MAIVEFRDDKTGNIFTADLGDQQITPELLEEVKYNARVNAQTDLQNGNYGYIGVYDKIKLPTDVRRNNLAKNTALVLDVPISSVDASESPLGIFARMGLSFRATPQEKYDKLMERFATEDNPQPIKRIAVNNQERLLLEQKDEEGNSTYSYIDEEGFSVGDIADYAKDLPAIALSTVASIMTAPATGGTSMAMAFGLWGLRSAAISGATYGAVGYAQDMGIKSFDEAVDKDAIDWAEYRKFSSERFGVRSKEAVTTALVDLVALKSFGLVASRFGSKGADDAVQKIDNSIQRLNTKYANELNKPLKRSNVRTEEGLVREADAAKSSNILKNMYRRNREGLEAIAYTFTTGDTSLLRATVESASREMAKRADRAKIVVGEKIQGLSDAIQKSYDRALTRNGINGFFDAEDAGMILRDRIVAAKNVSQTVKDDLYEATFVTAKAENITYSIQDVVRTLQRRLNEYRGKLSIGFGEDIVSSLNKTLGTNLKSLDDLFSKDVLPRLAKGLKAKQIDLRQLDAIIKNYSDKANYGLFSANKSQDEIVAEMMSNALRKLRDNAIPANSNTAKLQAKATEYYNNNWLRFYRYLGGKSIQESNKELTMTGAKLLDSTLLDLRQINELIRIMPDAQSRNAALNALRSRYYQNHGADGAMLINAGNKISYDTNMIRTLFGTRNSKGELIKGAKTEALVREKVKALDDINKLSSTSPKAILELPETELKALLNASNKTQIKIIKNRIEGIRTAQLRESELLKAAMPRIASSGELSANPNVYIKTLMEMNEAELKEVMDIVRKLDGGASLDRLRTAYTEQLFLLSKKGMIGVDVADSGLVIKNLRKGTASGDNSRIVLGKERVKDLEDWFRVANYSQRPNTTLSPEVRAVASGDNITWVSSHIFEPIQRKLWGMAATQGWLKPLAKSASPEEFAYRAKSVLPWILVAESSLDVTVNDLMVDPYYSNFFANELDLIDQNRTDEQPSESSDMSEPPMNNPEGGLDPAGGQELTLPQVQKNVHANPLGL